ncbi:hypothetical protein C0991_008452 [Blastosporella zonata]|nr:hypothetical protein C0991_008452 [Blastosporella zonata]
MVLKLYGSGGSTCTRRVGAFLREKKIPFELVEIDLAHGEHKSPAYLKKQPFGQIPYIDDDGFILYESRAICRYLEEKFPNNGPKLIPTEIKAKAIFEQAASVELNNFEERVHSNYLSDVQSLQPNVPVALGEARARKRVIGRLGKHVAPPGEFV